MRGHEQFSGTDAITITPNASGQLWTQDPKQWRDLCSREGCPWCQGPGPPAEDIVAETERCWVTAPVVAAVPGYVCVSTKAHAVEPYELDEHLQVGFWLDAMATARGLADAVKPVKMNYEIHGNTIPHLHMHLFPRSPGDPYVGHAIHSRIVVTRTPEQLATIGDAIRTHLAACGRLG